MKRSEVYIFRFLISLIIWNLVRIVLIQASITYDVAKYDAGHEPILRIIFDKLIVLLNPSYQQPLLSSIGKIEIEKYLSIVIAFPFYFLILLGCYCLSKLGLDLVYFRNCPDESTRLSEDIIKAREDLKKRGYRD